MLSGSVGTDQGISAYRFQSQTTGGAYFINPQALASNPFTLTFPTTSTFVIPEAGRYICVYLSNAATSVVPNNALSASTNATLVSNFWPSGATGVTSGFNASGAAANASSCLAYCFDIVSNNTQVGGTITTSGGTLTITGGCSSLLLVMCVPTSFTFGSSMANAMLQNLHNKVRDIAQKIKSIEMCRDDEQANRAQQQCQIEEEKEYTAVVTTNSNKPNINPAVPARKGFF